MACSQFMVSEPLDGVHLFVACRLTCVKIMIQNVNNIMLAKICV